MLVLQVAASLAAATILCTAFHFWKAPQHMSPWHAIQVAALAAVVLTLARSLILEASYQVLTLFSRPCVSLAQTCCQSLANVRIAAANHNLCWHAHCLSA